MDKRTGKSASWVSLLIVVALLTTALSQRAGAQDQDDPPGRVARLGYLQGAVSFQPAGEPEWVEAVLNRPMTTGDRLWADQGSRAEVELGYAVVRLGANTGFSFLNLDDRTTQIRLESGSISFTVRRLNPDGIFEVDTPNLAFSVFQPGRYRMDATEDGNYTVVSVDSGAGEATGNGQNYALHSKEKYTFSGTESLTAEVESIYSLDEFDNWALGRDLRRQRSVSAQYLSHDVVGYEDLDDHGEWRSDSNYGHVWFPTQVSAGWAPYREGHWDWISPWGWTWVDDAPWGYAPYHYGRWVRVRGRWGWVAGPVDVAPVFAPALVVFIGIGGAGGNVGWFPLGPREVYVPSYKVSRGYMNRVNVSNTTVTNTTITNVYNTNIINKSTTITNVNYMNKNVAGAVTAVPQRAFVNSQPVAKAAVAVNVQQMGSSPVSARAAVAPSQESVLGSRANSAGHVAAPPPAVASRQVVAKAPPPPPPVPFAKQQQALAAQPGKPLAKQEVQALRPANPPASKMVVKLAPPGKPATPKMVRPGSAAGNSPNAAAPAAPPANSPPAGGPGNQPAPNARPEPPNPAQPNAKPQPTPSAPVARPEPGRPSAPPPARPNNRPQPTPSAPAARPGSGRPSAPPPARPNNRPQLTPHAPNAKPEPNHPSGRPQEPGTPDAKTGSGQQKKRQPPKKPLTPEEKKRQDEQRKLDVKPQPPQSE